MEVQKREWVSYKQRCAVKTLRFSVGWTYRQIADEQNLSVSTVFDICQAPTTLKKPKGQPFSLDTPTLHRLVATATMSAAHRRMPLLEVAAACGVQACQRTLRGAFQIEGYSRRVARKKPFLDERKKGLRLAFAMASREWTREDWRRVIWTNESYVWLSGHSSQVWVTRRPGEEYDDDCLLLKLSKQDTIMVWGAILGGRKCAPVLWDKDNWGRITARSYVDNVLIPVLQPLWQRESEHAAPPLWLMEDGASAYWAHYIRRIRE